MNDVCFHCGLRNNIETNKNILKIDLDALDFSYGERLILQEMKRRYYMYDLYREHHSQMENENILNIVRGMKYAFDLIVETDAGKKLSYDWQATLY